MTMNIRTQSVGGEVYNDHDRPPRKFPPGRVCAELDCGVHVSIYNASEYCSLHEVKMAPRMRGRRIKGPRRPRN
jgi:hypothetical protein